MKPNTEDQAVEIAEKYRKVMRELPGHVSTIMFIDGDSFMSISTWDTKEHAEAAAAVRDSAQQDLTDVLSGAPSTTIAATIVHDLA